MTDDHEGHDPLQLALEVEAFIASCRVDGAHGSTWVRVPGGKPSSKRTLYHGSAGIILFYIELFRATGDQRFLDIALDGGNELMASLGGEFVSIAIYSGLPGYMFVFNELAIASGEDRFRDAAVRMLNQIAEQSQALGSGVGWIEPMPFSDITGLTGDREVLDLSIGSAGAGIGLLYAHRHGLDDRVLDLAKQTADRLMEMSVDGEGGPNWLMMADMPFPFDAPNFAHGAAGVGYFLADLHRETGEQRYLDTAIAAAGYVEAHTTPHGDGHLVCHTDQHPDLYYLGLCHGPPGTGRLMHLLHGITGDERWMNWLHGNMRGLCNTGAPEARSRGLWQNRGQCCGDAGIGDYALSLLRTTGRAEYRELAERVAAEIIEHSTITDGRRSWEQAEHRNRPDFVETQTGYMQGAAGIGSFLLHLATVDRETPAKVALPDSPFTN